MEERSNLVFAGVAPHPPIMVPEVGREAIAEVQGSIDAMAEFSRRILNSGAETVILISPHAPLDPEAFVAYRSATLYGDFKNFRAPQTVVEAELDDTLLAAVVQSAARQGYEVLPRAEYELDHGTAVPLYFLLRNGWAGRVVALGYSFLSNDDHIRFGGCLRQAVEDLGRNVALVASGDLSHRLMREAPAGYSPNAYLFDQEVVAAIEGNEPEKIRHINPDLRHLAGECGYRSLLIALGAIADLPLACEVLHYEAPFGVGYLVAQLTIESANERRVDQDQAKTSAEGRVRNGNGLDDALPTLARTAVEQFVRHGVVIDDFSGVVELTNTRGACFVSLKTSTGELRGCIGTVEPTKDCLAAEIVANAISAATQDPRFMPVRKQELSGLSYSVDVLEAPEPATFEQLDPAIYGVIVEDEAGLRRGLLLPDIPGIDTAEKQVEIASRKAGLPLDAPAKLFRFRVHRFREIRNPY